MEKTEKTSKIYELGYLVVPTIAEENLIHEVQAIKTILAEGDAVTITEDSPKLRPLSYTMLKVIGSNRSKYDKAYFGWIKFEVSPTVLASIKTKIEKIESLLRTMIIETVRENTMVAPKVAVRTADTPLSADAPKKAASEEDVHVSDADLDKTIDSLVGVQN